jgi:hypothetical protein
MRFAPLSIKGKRSKAKVRMKALLLILVSASPLAFDLFPFAFLIIAS